MSHSFPIKYFGKHNNKEVPSREYYEKNTPSKKRPLFNFIKNLPHQANVLDAGCGNGKAIKMIIALRPDIKISGIDISDTKSYLPDRVNFVIGSIEDIDQHFPENSFDAIICLHVLEHLLYPMKTIAAFRKTLKPNSGLLFIEVPNWTRILYPFSDKFFWNDYTHVRIFTKKSMRRLLENFSFKIKLIKTTVSSAVIEETDTITNLKNRYQEQRWTPIKFIKKIFKFIFIRSTNLIVKDLLIVIAQNEK